MSANGNWNSPNGAGARHADTIDRCKCFQPLAPLVPFLSLRARTYHECRVDSHEGETQDERITNRQRLLNFVRASIHGAARRDPYSDREEGESYNSISFRCTAVELGYCTVQYGDGRNINRTASKLKKE